MKLKLSQFPLLFSLIAGTAVVTAMGFAGRYGAYGDYEYTYVDSPVLSLFFRGFSDGVYPWTVSQQDVYDGVTVEEVVDNPETSVADGGNVADISGDDLLADVSGNDAADISGNDNIDDVSGNSITYTFGQVDDDYFTDAVFIGDSRTVGLSEYCEELDSRATFYGKVSLTIYDLMNNEFVKTDNGKVSVEKALSENQFGKVYMMVGLNEIGTGTVETFTQKYSEVVERIKELQPDAIIYIQGIMHVTANKSDNDKYFTNSNIDIRNQALSELADGERVFYIDMNEAVDDENGNLRADLSFDDVHLKASSYELWHQYLLNNAVIFN